MAEPSKRKRHRGYDGSTLVEVIMDQGWLAMLLFFLWMHGWATQQQEAGVIRGASCGNPGRLGYVYANIMKRLWRKDGAVTTICCKRVPAKSPNCCFWRRFTEEEKEEGGARHHGSSDNNSWDYSDIPGSGKTYHFL